MLFAGPDGNTISKCSFIIQVCTYLQWQSAVHLLLHRLLSRRQAHTTVPPPLPQDAAALGSHPDTPLFACAGLCQRSTASQLGRSGTRLPLRTAQAAFQRQPAHPTARRWVQSSTVCSQPHAYVREAGLRCKHHTLAAASSRWTHLLSAECWRTPCLRLCVCWCADRHKPRVHAGSTFELLLVAASRAGVNPQVFAEESSLGGVNLPQPATGWPVSTCLLPGVLSMQVVLEESATAAAGAGAGTPGATQPAAAASNQ